MRRKGFLPAVILTGLILCFIAAPAYGYFTANTQAEGGLVIEPIHTTPDEDIVNQEKHLKIHNEDDGTPVYVRARGFSGDDSALVYSGEDGWIDGDDGWWYYEPILDQDADTSVLTISISKVIPVDAEVGDSFNVVVVYEAIRPVDGAVGSQESFKAYLAEEGGNK